jgi:D-3-phosphoglycerate dehydrogenase
MATVFQEADIISFHIPLTDETFYLVNDDYINMFSKNIVLLNLSRGKVVKLSAVVVAMRNGKVVASGLDVLENERVRYPFC